MDASYNLASKDDIWRLQNDMKSVYAVQAEHADRLLRLERRYDDDSRVKSVWGTTSSVPSVRGGTPHQEPGYNPAAEAFRNFDQDNSNSLLGSLHIEPDEEPRRGTSRANSVRFDESSLHGQLTHTSRSSSEFFPIRTGSGFGSHPLTERSSSHKAEGRQSSTGVLTHSSALNGLAFDSNSNNATTEPVPRPAPGLFLLGPCPSIIRCWLGAKFSNETLRYAAICTGAAKSTITRGLVEDSSLAHLITEGGDESQAKLQIYFPEATVRQQSLGSSSPAPQLPAVTATLTVVDAVPSEPHSIQLFLGSDVLRAKSADVLLSQDRLVLYDDDGTRVNVPLIRPENSTMFKDLVTTNISANIHRRPAATSRTGLGAVDSSLSISNDISRPARSPVPALASSMVITAAEKPRSRIDWSRARSGQPVTSSQGSPQPKDPEPQTNDSHRRPDEADNSLASPTPVTPGPSEADESWTSWRRGVSTANSTNAAITAGDASNGPATSNANSSSRPTPSSSQTTFSSVASTSTTPRVAAGKGMKVLKTRRTSSTRSISTSDYTRPEVSPALTSGSWGQQPRDGSSSWSQPPPQLGQPPLNVTTPLETPSALAPPLGPVGESARRTYSTDHKSPVGPPGSSNRPSNPVGGASAFGWLNSGQR